VQPDGAACKHRCVGCGADGSCARVLLLIGSACVLVLMGGSKALSPTSQRGQGQAHTGAKGHMSYLRGAQESWHGAERADAASQLRCVPFPLWQAQVTLTPHEQVALTPGTARPRHCHTLLHSVSCVHCVHAIACIAWAVCKYAASRGSKI
jgi:hypothetical protein